MKNSNSSSPSIPTCSKGLKDLSLRKRSSTIHWMLATTVPAKVEATPTTVLELVVLLPPFNPFVFGRNLQCQLVRGANTREE
jgi:hypothetical protein